MADFVQTLMEMRNGSAASDCSAKLTELIGAIQDTGKKGKITLDILITPSKLTLGKVTEVEVEHTCKIAKPEHNHGRSIFFTDQDGALTRHDPNQMEMYQEIETDVRR